ncbi:hypothetical protein ES703_71511 [subsurface metagenome]
MIFQETRAYLKKIGLPAVGYTEIPIAEEE